MQIIYFTRKNNLCYHNKILQKLKIKIKINKNAHFTKLNYICFKNSKEADLPFNEVNFDLCISLYLIRASNFKFLFESEN